MDNLPLTGAEFRRCEVAKLAFCSENVKTTPPPSCEVAPDGGGCVKIKYYYPIIRISSAIQILPSCDQREQSRRCEVAKLAFCSEDVKTTAPPSCEVAPDGGGVPKV